jgi:hypothetical protein
LVEVAACSPQPLQTGKPGPRADASVPLFDASARLRDATSNDPPFDDTPFDAGGCGCRIGNDGVMRMSWTCFHPSYGVSPELGWCGAPGEWTSACGLDVFTYYNQNGLLQQYVYDENGVQVGAHYENLDTPFGCPDQTVQSLKVESGTFPASSCTVTACACNFDRGDGTFTCPAPDGGAGQDAAVSPDAAACDCQIGTDGVLRMSLGCFCSGYGCGQPELGWCGGDGQWTSACGLNAFTVVRSGLPQTFVYDESGTEVGVRYESSDGAYVCPADPSLQAKKIAGGSFPDSSCAAAVCSCNADGTFTCPAPDASIFPAAGSER